MNGCGCEKRDKKMMELKRLIHIDTMEAQTTADDILNTLSAASLEEVFEYCKREYEYDNQKKYFLTMERITDIAKFRLLEKQSHELPIGRYVDNIIGRRIEYSIASNPIGMSMEN